MRLTRSQVQPIGLDIGHDSIKMMQLEVRGQKLAVKAAAKHTLDAETRASTDLVMTTAVDAIRRMVQYREFSGREVIVALPREILHVKNLRLPQMPANDLAAAVKFEARNIFPFETNDAQIEYLP